MIVLVFMFFSVLCWAPLSWAQAGKPMSIVDLAAYNKPDWGENPL